MEIRGNIKKVNYNSNGFMVFEFTTKNSIATPDGEKNSFIVKGNSIPEFSNQLLLDGTFKKSINKYTKEKEIFFQMETWLEARYNEKDCIVQYISSIKGSNATIAENIYNNYGDNTFDVLDNNISVLKNIPDIDNKRYELIAKDYVYRSTLNRLDDYLAKHEVSRVDCHRIYDLYKAESLEIVVMHPYKLYLENLLGFDISDAIANENENNDYDEERIMACIVHAIELAEEDEGHTYVLSTELSGRNVRRRL